MSRPVLLILLLFAVLAGTGENIHSRLLALGTTLWEDYATLRQDAPAPDCDPDFDLQSRLDALEAESLAADDGLDLFAETFDREAAARSLENQRQLCRDDLAAHALRLTQVDAGLRAFRWVEQGFASLILIAIEQQPRVLMLTLLLAAFLATRSGHHIAFRTVHTRLDHRVSLTAQTAAHALLSLSALTFWMGKQSSGMNLHQADVILLLALGAGGLTALTLWQIGRRPPELQPGGSLGNALLTIPIYTWMLLFAGLHFWGREGHLPGIAIYFTQLLQMSGLYLNIALFLWVGMLLKQTRLGERLFAVLVPLRLPPGLLAVVALLLTALPTAYTGASGIIVLALGAVVYQEMRRVGTRRQFAQAVTAMTGSTGVVLQPCLLVVGIAMLNKEVVTAELFDWGLWVFLLSQVVFLGFALAVKTTPLHWPRDPAQWRSCAHEARSLWPYILIGALILGLYALVLNAHLDEFSAPIILPVLLLAWLAWERRRQAADGTWRQAVGQSIGESGTHIGALLMLMGCSFAVGGLLQNSGGASLVTLDLGSPLLAMALLMVCLVVIGMLMDPFGALVLVSATLAPMAYANGIHPIHFWMTCLVAFELGYLTPPVALNHLLTRQAVGSEEIEAGRSHADLRTVPGGFYYRHERYLLPLMTMIATLLIVAFAPLVWR